MFIYVKQLPDRSIMMHVEPLGNGTFKCTWPSMMRSGETMQVVVDRLPDESQGLKRIK